MAGDEERVNIDPKVWEILPILRKEPWPAPAGEPPKVRISAISQVWHGLCSVLGMKRNDFRTEPNHRQGDRPMLNTDTSRNLFAAAISLGVSAILFAYAIIPASPSLVA
ncbi:hypothetical protein [Erythrobacter sp.]|uniref:hypothetical protein n=1 Tax=Erythrobacter sp. TaxID=1042 RepID=UPI002ED0A89B